MNTNPIPIVQLPLFAYGETLTNIVELFPAVWSATEALTAPDSVSRQHALDALLEMGAQRVSPLVAYVIATCLNDQDIYFRKRVVYILADLIKTSPNGMQSPEDVRNVVANYLHNMRESTVYGLIEVSVLDHLADECIYHLFNSCPYVGKCLGDILTQWKNPLPIRQKAIYFIGVVGYLEALPILERMLTRMEARQNGQTMMAFAPPSIKSDEDILPYLRVAVNQLNAR
jgi:hypothetical protein